MPDRLKTSFGYKAFSRDIITRELAASYTKYPKDTMRAVTGCHYSAGAECLWRRIQDITVKCSMLLDIKPNDS